MAINYKKSYFSSRKHAQRVGVCAKIVVFCVIYLRNSLKIRYFAPAKRHSWSCTFKIRKYFINILKKKIMAEIESKVKAIIVDKLGVDEAEVKPEASFTNDLGADSLDTVELIMEFEKEFGISIPDDKAEKIATVGDAIAYIEENAK